VRDNIALIVDTNSNYSDVWAPCFGRLERYAKGIKKYAFTDKSSGITDIPSDVAPITYDNAESYRNQLLSCLKQIDEKYIIYTSEDYILFNQVQILFLWNTRDFQKVFEAAPATNTRMQHEPGGSAICRKLGLKGLQHYSGTQRRGIHHHDSEIFPCIATAVVKGLWNMSEYPSEMSDVVREYNIDLNLRGWR
jgi:hypothetical protein